MLRGFQNLIFQCSWGSMRAKFWWRSPSDIALLKGAPIKWCVLVVFCQNESARVLVAEYKWCPKVLTIALEGFSSSWTILRGYRGRGTLNHLLVRGKTQWKTSILKSVWDMFKAKFTQTCDMCKLYLACVSHRYALPMSKKCRMQYKRMTKACLTWFDQMMKTFLTHI